MANPLAAPDATALTPRAARVTGRGAPAAPGVELRAIRGLTADEARDRLAAEGPNALPAPESRALLTTILGVMREPMFMLLVAAGALYLLLGELGDALTLMAFVVVVIVITVVQERRTERALEALRDLSSPRALVVRDGRAVRIAGREVVRGDFLVLAEGERVPADALVRQAVQLAADESLLTGESAPVRKRASATATRLDAPGGDDLASVFSGTLITSGQAVAEVVATGPRTELGRIGKALAETQAEPTSLEREIRSLVRRVAVLGLALSVFVVVLYALSRGGSALAWKQGGLAGIALAMAVLPEEFPVVLTVYLALGAYRLSRRRVLARRMPAVEALGATTVLCTDKTGTLTENKMALAVLATGDVELPLVGSGSGSGASELPEGVHGLLEVAILASKRDPFDPMELALVRAGDTFLAGTEHLHPSWKLVHEYPLTADRFAVIHLWKHAGDATLEAACKGAPEAVARLCGLDTSATAALLARAGALAARGQRVLAVAEGRVDGDTPPDDPKDLGLRVVGLLGFEDPLRATVPEAVAECHRAGIRVVMITGDAPTTARAIARQAGLAAPDAVLTGPELAALSDAELATRIGDVHVFARVVPEQKLRIVRALTARGEVVAMTGDGVNDAPALKAAQVGVAMGKRGTDVAREAAGLVVLDDDFASIVAAIATGRRIYDNIKKAMTFIVAVHVPIAALTVAEVLAPSWPLLLMPVHVAFLELVIDPACSIVFEAEAGEPGLMDRRPRPRRARLLTGATVGLAVLQGASVLAACLAVFLLSRDEHGDDAARALTFTTLVVGFLAMVLANRSTQPTLVSARRPPAATIAIVVGTLSALAAVLLVPALQRRFRFAPLHAGDALFAAAAGVACLLWLEALKRLRTGRRGAPTSRGA